MHTVPRSQFPAARLLVSLLLSHLSVFPTSVAHNLWLRPAPFQPPSPSCDSPHAISYLFTSPSPAPLCQPVTNCVFPSPSCHLAGLISSLPPTHSMYLSAHHHFYALPFSSLCPFFSPFNVFSHLSLLPVLKWV